MLYTSDELDQIVSHILPIIFHGMTNPMTTMGEVTKSSTNWGVGISYQEVARVVCANDHNKTMVHSLQICTGSFANRPKKSTSCNKIDNAYKRKINKIFIVHK